MTASDYILASYLAAFLPLVSFFLFLRLRELKWRKLLKALGDES
jgi:hypothetical protein